MKQSLLYILLILTLNSFCQHGTLKGIVRNGVDNIPSPYITIVLNQKNKLIAATNSDSTGHFEIDNISPGEYELMFSFVGYQSYKIPKFSVINDSTTFLETKYPCPTGKSKSKNTCPYGHKNNIVPIIYGLPTENTLKRANKGKCELGGCLVTDCDPKWYCKEHKISF